MSEYEDGYFKLTKSKDVHNGQPYHFVLKAPNHETILTSENYTASRGARSGIDSVCINGVIEERFEILSSKRNEPYFVLKAANHEIIGQSEMYSSLESCKHGIKAVMKYAAHASLIDETGSGDSTGPIVTSHPKRSQSNKYA